MTDPLVPSDCDLRGMPFMPLHCQRLLDSDLFAISTGDEFKAAVALWCKSWFQVPAGSLPNDERVLEHLSSSKSWKKVRAMAMRGWTLCSDDRYYHPLITEYVLEAWERREDFREVKTNKETRQQRWREKVKHLSGLLRSAGVTPPMNPSLKELLSLCETHVPDFVDADVDAQASTVRRPVDKNETAKTGDRGQGTGDSKKTEDIARAHPDLSAGEATKAMRAAGLQDANPSHPELIALLTAGITIDELQAAATSAAATGKGFVYALRTAAGRRRDAAKVGSLPTARTPSRGGYAAERNRAFAGEFADDAHLTIDEEKPHGIALPATRR
jgi:hypothetical protein